MTLPACLSYLPKGNTTTIQVTTTKIIVFDCKGHFIKYIIDYANRNYYMKSTSIDRILNI